MLRSNVRNRGLGQTLTAATPDVASTVTNDDLASLKAEKGGWEAAISGNLSSNQKEGNRGLA